ncbi:MAG: DUF2961 domain-containing protein, partial [Planctomycetes bacterium]|nr:DUF2961 domain-containing protein [Planctomycetota bacterium]
LEPGGSMEAKLEGPAAIRMLRVRLDAEDLPQALRSTVLSIAFDGEETVWCPAGDFFGSGVGLNPYRDWFRDVDRSGLLTAWWVMPFERSCVIRLHNLGEREVDATLGAIAWSDWAWDERSMHFWARWRQEHGIATPRQDGIDWNYVEIRGRGVYVGDALAIHNGSGAWWGEGDEKIFVDGEAFPSHFGTGSEDYYGYSYGWPHVFEAPFHAQPRAEGNDRPGYTTNTRTRALDAIPFSRSLKLDMEIWHWDATKVTYAAATYFYARPGAVSNRPRLPAEAARPLGEVENRIPGAIEGESMEIIEKTGGVTETQSDGRWSGGRQLWWRDGEPGDRLVLALSVPRAGTYRIAIHTTRAFDYGIFRFSLDGEGLGGAVDIYSEENVVGLTELGVRTLAAGAHRFAAQIAGTNPAAKPRHMLGLDYVKLEEVKP